MLTLTEDNQAIAAALSTAQMKMKIAVSVCDEGGRCLVAFQRMDGAFSESIALAIGKAIGAVASTKSSAMKTFFMVGPTRLPSALASVSIPLTERKTDDSVH